MPRIRRSPLLRSQCCCTRREASWQKGILLQKRRQEMLQERRQKVLQEGRQKILQEGLHERLQKGMQRKEGLLRRTRLWRQKELRQEVNLLLSSAICTSGIHTASTHGLVQFFLLVYLTSQWLCLTAESKDGAQHHISFFQIADYDWQNVVFIKEKTSLAGTLHLMKATKQAFATYSNLPNEKNKEKMSKKHRQFLIAFQNT